MPDHDTVVPWANGSQQRSDNSRRFPVSNQQTISEASPRCTRPQGQYGGSKVIGGVADSLGSVALPLVDVETIPWIMIHNCLGIVDETPPTTDYPEACSEILVELRSSAAEPFREGEGLPSYDHVHTL